MILAAKSDPDRPPPRIHPRALRQHNRGRSYPPFPLPLRDAFLPWSSFLTIVFILAFSAHARASETDYLPDNTSWNGLSRLAELAAGQQIPLVPVTHLPWDEVDARDLLFIVYPRSSLDPEKVLIFLRRGGHVLIADDFGSAAPLLRALGILRHAYRARSGASSRSQTYASNPALPFAFPGRPALPLLAGVHHIVTNHPSVFTSTHPSLLTLHDKGRGQVLVAGKIGAGRFIALSDPSVLINGMLKFEGNARLATNLLADLGRGRRRVILLTGVFTQSGDNTTTTTSQASQVATARRLNLAVDHINDFALSALGMRILAFVFAGVLFGLILIVTPSPRKDLDGRWLRPGTRLSRFDATGHIAFELREEIEARLAEALDTSDPIFSLPPRWVSDRLRERFGDDAADVCHQLLRSLRQISYAPELGSFREPPQKKLASLYELARRLLDHLGDDKLPSISSSLGSKT